MITRIQCKAARALLEWGQAQLAEHAGISAVTIRNFEKGNTSPYPATLAVLRQKLESAGVEFIDENGGGAGVRLRKISE